LDEKCRDNLIPQPSIGFSVSWKPEWVADGDLVIAMGECHGPIAVSISFSNPAKTVQPSQTLPGLFELAHTR
jgi:hypothetical protein